MHRNLTRFSTVLLTLGLAVAAAPASAHVTVDSDDVTQGGYGKLTFSVPNESDTAATTKVTVTLPGDTPVPSLRSQPTPGWKATVNTEELPEPVEVAGTTITEGVTSIVWTATGDGVGPGEFQEFAVAGGPFPETGELMLPAEQTYDDGEVVAWEQPADGDTEPERPAPVLMLGEAGDSHHGSGDGSEAADDTEQVSASGEVADATSSGTVMTLASLALVVALSALGVAVLGLRQNRQRG